MTLVKTDRDTFMKDESTGAILNTDRAGLRAAIARRAHSQRIEETEKQVQEIKEELLDIKNLLLKLIDR